MQTFKTIGVGILGVVVGLLLAGAVQNNNLGGVYNEVETTFRNGIKVGTTNQFSIDNSGNATVVGLTTSGSELTFGSSATTTFDVNLFCIEMHPTSTETTYSIRASTTAPTGRSPLVGSAGGC